MKDIPAGEHMLAGEYTLVVKHNLMGVANTKAEFAIGYKRVVVVADQTRAWYHIENNILN